MSRPIVKRLDSLAELRNTARAWDELWQRSEIELPTARAALVALWCEFFAAGQPFRAFVVEHDGQVVAALPLIESKWLGLKTSLLPGNHWSPAGDLLLDPQCDVDCVCSALLGALKHHAGPLLWFGAVPVGANRWQIFLKAFQDHRIAYSRRQRCTIDRVEIEGNWDVYLGARSRNHRRHMRKAVMRAERAGATGLACYDQLTPDEVEPLLKTCFEIEVCGWKGKARSAVLNVPGAWDFYLRQAKQLAAWGQLRLTFLTHEARPIAFEYGWRSKGVYFSPKVGYDETFRQLTPGQLLRSRLLEQFHHQSGLHWVDFLGPSSVATSKWATEQYAIDRVIVAARGPLSRAIVAAYRHYNSLFSTTPSRGPQGECRRQAAQLTPDNVPSGGASEGCEPALLD